MIARPPDVQSPDADCHRTLWPPGRKSSGGRGPSGSPCSRGGRSGWVVWVPRPPDGFSKGLSSARVVLGDGCLDADPNAAEGDHPGAGRASPEGIAPGTSVMTSPGRLTHARTRSIAALPGRQSIGFRHRCNFVRRSAPGLGTIASHLPWGSSGTSAATYEARHTLRLRAEDAKIEVQDRFARIPAHFALVPVRTARDCLRSSPPRPDPDWADRPADEAAMDRFSRSGASDRGVQETP